jgi:hypothetical protein
MGLGKKKNVLSARFTALNKLIAEQKAYRAKYRKVFEAAEELASQISVAEAEIKALLAEEYRGKPSGVHTVFNGSDVLVTVTPQNERILDAKGLLEHYGAEMRELGVVVTVPAVAEHETIDKKRLDEAVHRKLISSEVVQRYVTAGPPKTPAVSFKQPAPAQEKK